MGEHLVKKITRTLYTTAAATTITGTIKDIGVLTRYLLEIPNLTGDWTTTLSLKDANGIVIFTGAAHTENANYSVPIDVEIDGEYTVTLTFSGTATAGELLYLTFWIRDM